ncbi:MAG TPA: hypothetical protein HA306_01110 [Methanosarcina sp.]|nr:hypothetical protein [Methanosarcina sp.]
MKNMEKSTHVYTAILSLVIMGSSGTSNNIYEFAGGFVGIYLFLLTIVFIFEKAKLKLKNK